MMRNKSSDIQRFGGKNGILEQLANSLHTGKMYSSKFAEENAMELRNMIKDIEKGDK